MGLRFQITMSKPLKEYLCLAHGPFESRSTKPSCPHGCTTVERRFFTTPMIATNGPMVRQLDQLKNEVASRYGLRDLKTPDPGQTMAQKLGLTGSTGKPTSPQEALALMAAGKFNAPAFLPLNTKLTANDRGINVPDMASPVPHMHAEALAAGARDAKIVDPEAARQAKFRDTLYLVHPKSRQDSEDFGKVMEQTRPVA